MNAMILCAACRRHVFAREDHCPFCGFVLAAGVRRASTPDASPDLSRAHRYAIGTALAMSVAGAGCGPGPMVVRPAPTNHVEAGGESTDTPPADGEASSGEHAAGPEDTRGGGTGLSVAGDGPKDGAKDGPRPDPTGDTGWRRRGSPCVQSPKGIVCPPYGCVFPDETCDLVRA